MHFEVRADGYRAGGEDQAPQRRDHSLGAHEVNMRTLPDEAGMIYGKDSPGWGAFAIYPECGPANLVRGRVIDAKDELITWALKYAEEYPLNVYYRFMPEPRPLLTYGVSAHSPYFSTQVDCYFWRDEIDKYIEAMYSIMAGTLSAQVNSASTLFSTDLYKKLIHREASDREMVRVGRIASFVVLLLAAVISPVVGRFGIFKFFQFALTAIAIPFMATILMGVLWKRVNYPAALFGLVGGVAITSLLMAIFSGRWTGIPELHFFYIGGIAEAIVVGGIACVALLTAPPDYAKIAPYVWRLQLLRAYDEGVQRPWYQQLRLWCGIVAVVWFYIYWRFW